jgi:hypothetical protein
VTVNSKNYRRNRRNLLKMWLKRSQICGTDEQMRNPRVLVNVWAVQRIMLDQLHRML